MTLLSPRFGWAGVAFLSGVPALMAQVVWARQVALTSGAESEGLALVVAAFFSGLAAGARVLGPALDRNRIAPALGYALLEAGVGGLLLAIAFLGLTERLADASEAVGIGRRFGAALPVLPSAFLMGGTLPAMLRATAGADPAARDAGRLLASNTLGSVAGALLAVATIPVWGLRLCLAGAGALSLLASVAALALGAGTARPAQPPDGHPPGAGKRLLAGSGTGQVLAAATGFVSLGFEIATARLTVLALGSSLLGWGVVLATTLASLALGNACGNRLARSPDRIPERLPLLLVASAIGVISAPFLLGHHPAAPSTGLSYPILARTIFCIGPAMVTLGAAFPLLVSRTVRETDRAADFGRLTAFNMLGGVLGSLSTAFVLLPELGPTGAVRAIAGVATMAALLSAGLPKAFATRDDRRHQPPPPRLPARQTVAFAALLLAGTLASEAPIPLALRERVISIEHGRRATTVVMRSARSRELLVDGEPEASTYGSARRTEALLAAIPLLYHPRPDRFLELGLGAGITLATAGRFGPSVLDVVEIAPSVRAAQAFFAPDNALRPSTKDRASRVLIGDARSFLRRIAHLRDGGGGGYDVIAANTAQPWSRHATGLYSREHYLRMRGALSERGLVVQWLPYDGVSALSLGEILRTFFSVFDHGGVWWGDGSLFALGSGSEIAPFDSARASERLSRAGLTAADLGLASVDALELRRIATAETIRVQLRDFALLTEDVPRLEDPRRGASPTQALDLLSRLVEAQRAESAMVAPIAAYVKSLRLERAGEASRAAMLQSTLRAAGLALGDRAALERALRAIEEALTRGDFEEARDLRSELPPIPEPDARIALLDGILAEQAGRTDAAAQIYRSGMERTPRDSLLPLRLGLLLEKRRPSEAIAAFDIALENDPTLIEAIAGRGRLAARAGDRQDGQRQLERLRALSPLGPRPESLELARQLRDGQ